MTADVLHEIGAEVAGRPAAFLAEILQFALLVAIVWFAAFGTKRRRGLLVGYIEDAEKRVARQAERIAGAADLIAEAKEQAEQIAAEAGDEASRLRTEAEVEADGILATTRADAEAEAERVRMRAIEVVAAETDQAERAAQRELEEVVAQATRTLLGRTTNPSERAGLVERAIADLDDDMRTTSPADRPESSAHPRTDA